MDTKDLTRKRAFSAVGVIGLGMVGAALYGLLVNKTPVGNIAAKVGAK